MTTLPNMGIVLPSLGADIGTWDDKLNAGLTLVDAHDHTSGKGTAIRSAALSIDADLGFGDNGLTAVGRVAFTAVAALAAGQRALFVSSADNELYWRTNAGVNVKLTAGTSINTSLVGGIVGDYASVGAAFAYEDATKRYTAKTQTATWARLHAGALRLTEYNTSETTYVQLLAPAVLTSSYDVTWASALPASQALVQVTAAGQLVYSNTLDANLSVTVSGTGDFKHGDKKHVQDPVHAISSTGTHSFGFTGSAMYTQVASGATTVFPIRGLRQGDRVKSVAIFATSTIEPTVSVRLQSQSSASTLASTGNGTILGGSRTQRVLNSSNTMSGDDDFISIVIAAGAAAVNVYTIQVIYDRA